MKYQLMLLALCSALLFTACQKEEINCRDSRIAVYEGSDGAGGTITVDVQEGAGEKGVIMVYTFNNPAIGNPSSATVIGELNESCSTITIPKQMVGSSETEGSLVITEEKMTGSISTNGVAYPLNLDRK